ncbi:MAG: adenylosuccinate synthetase [Lachnospiraceae bacterium]|nr:adenylosuccinate synthetase [Lachnospiraceae bacterium]
MQDVRIVIGANYGDEGKGLMTDFFAAQAVKEGKRVLVIPSNGGAQRGHTVTTPEGVRHVFQHFGSGTLAGADTWSPRFFIVNPMIFMNEYEKLKAEGAGDFHVAFDPECPISTPFDMITNQILEEHRGNARHGSCGIGIWETLIRQGKLLGEMLAMSDAEIKNYINTDCRNQMLKRLSDNGILNIPDRWRDIIDDEGLIDNFIYDLRAMSDIAVIRDGDILGEYDRLIFENGQGLLLDRSHREYAPHTTPSNTGFRNPAQLIRENLKGMQGDVECCYVTRTYLTRHGAGPFNEECLKEDINANMKDLTNVPNPHQGTIRYGKPNEKAILKRIREDFDSEVLPEGFIKRMAIAVTHVNEYHSGIVEFGDYISDGETREDVTN